MSTVIDRTALQYVYDYAQLDRVPDGPTSAALFLRAPTPDIAGGSAAFVSGDVLHVGLVRLDAAAQGRRHTHGSEQFDFVLSGALDVELDGVVYRVPERNAMHIPAGVPHRVVGCAAGTSLIVVKNKTYGIEPELLD